MATLLDQAYDIFVKLDIDANDASLMTELTNVVKKLAVISQNDSNDMLMKLELPLNNAIKFRKTAYNLSSLQESALKKHILTTIKKNIQDYLRSISTANDEQARQDATARMSSRSGSAAANSMFDSIKQGVPLKKAEPPRQKDPDEGKSDFAKAIGKRRLDLREDSESEDDSDSNFDFDDPKPAKSHKKKTKTTKRSFTQEPNVSQAAPSAKQAKTSTASTTAKAPVKTVKIETQNPTDKNAAKKAAAAAIDKKTGDVKGILSSLVVLTEKTLIATKNADSLSQQISASIEDRKFDKLPKQILDAKQAANDVMALIGHMEQFIQQNTKGFESVLKKELDMATMILLAANKERMAVEDKALYAKATLSKNAALDSALAAAKVALKKSEAHANHPNQQTMQDKEEAEAKRLKAEAEAKEKEEEQKLAQLKADQEAKDAALALKMAEFNNNLRFL